MSKILVNTERVREVGQRLASESARVAEIGQELQHAIGSLDTGAWDGRSRWRAEPLLSRVQPESAHVADGLDELGRKLVRVADVFEQEDNTAARNLEGMPWVDFEVERGEVLGIATLVGVATPAVMLASLPLTGDQAPVISDMTWEERFAYADALPGQIKALESEQGRLADLVAQDEQAIGALDQQIQDLQAKRDALQKEADDFWNKVKRDPAGWKWGFDDGFVDAPWRTKSDALEDQIAEYDQQIQELRARRNSLVQQHQVHQQDLDGVNQQLTALHQSQAELERTFQEGIPFDGPSPKYPYFPAGNCTKYAASRRNVPCSGNAHEWDEQAVGYEVGSRPVKGSVMVWETTVKGANSTYGHVAIVERVEKLDDGSFTVFYTDNGNMDPAYPASRVIKPGTEDISFIYGKLPESASAT
jgi:WXG100 family type VII secretion target